MEQVIQIAAVCLIAAMLALLVKGTSPALSFCISLSVCIALLLSLGSYMNGVASFLETILSETGLDAELFTPLLKVVAIAVISHLGAELCREAGEGAMASLMETAGTILGLTVSLPLLEAVWNLLAGLL